MERIQELLMLTFSNLGSHEIQKYAKRCFNHIFYTVSSIEIYNT